MNDTSLNDLKEFSSAYKIIGAFNEKYHDIVLRYINVFYPKVDGVFNVYCIGHTDDREFSIYAEFQREEDVCPECDDAREICIIVPKELFLTDDLDGYLQSVFEKREADIREQKARKEKWMAEIKVRETENRKIRLKFWDL